MKNYKLLSLVGLGVLMSLQLGLSQFQQVGSTVVGVNAQNNFGWSVNLSLDAKTFVSGNRLFNMDENTWTQLGTVICPCNTKSIVSMADATNVVFGDASSNKVATYAYISQNWISSSDGISSQTGSISLGDAVTLRNGFNSVLASGDALANRANAYFDYLGIWIPFAKPILGEAVGDKCGAALASSADGFTIAVGSPLNDGGGVDAGHVRIFHFPEEKLPVPDPGPTPDGEEPPPAEQWTQIGLDIDGLAAGDQAGFSVSINSDGSVVALGSPFNDQNGDDAGQVRVFKNINGSWIQVGSNINGLAAGDNFGYSISLNQNGDYLAVGAPSNGAGYVAVYRNVNDVWVMLKDKLMGEAVGDKFGHAVSISSDGLTVAVGAPLNDVNGLDAGAVSVYLSMGGVVSVNELLLDGVSIAPNPVSDRLNLQFTDVLPQTLYLSDLSGKVVLEKKLVLSDEVVDVSFLPKGVYVVTVKSNQQTLVSKIVKQ